MTALKDQMNVKKEKEREKKAGEIILYGSARFKFKPRRQHSFYLVHAAGA